MTDTHTQRLTIRNTCGTKDNKSEMKETIAKEETTTASSLRTSANHIEPVDVKDLFRCSTLVAKDTQDVRVRTQIHTDTLGTALLQRRGNGLELCDVQSDTHTRQPNVKNKQGKTKTNKPKVIHFIPHIICLHPQARRHLRPVGGRVSSGRLIKVWLNIYQQLPAAVTAAHKRPAERCAVIKHEHTVHTECKHGRDGQQKRSRQH